MAAYFGTDSGFQVPLGAIKQLVERYYTNLHKLAAESYERGALAESARHGPSLKRQALDVLLRLERDHGYPCNMQNDADWSTIRRAIDALPEQEEHQ